MLPVAVEPRGVRPFLDDAVRDGGGAVVEPAEAEALVWAASDRAGELRALLDAHPGIRWVQLPWAGIEPFLDVLDRDRLWTAGQGVYAAPVAEHALALTLACLRELKRRSLATTWERPGPGDRGGLSLEGAGVTLFGAGGIARALLPLLAPFGCRVTVVRRRAEPMAGAARTLAFSRAGIGDAVRDADVVILAAAVTPETRGMIDAGALAAMKPTACLVNVARGVLVDTAALVDALARGVIGSAGLDVTDPEPLPPGHPLWASARCLVTPHVANTPEMAVPLLSARVRENVRRRAHGEPLLGIVDVDAGY